MALPFDTAQDALNAAIAITNDAAASPVLAGNCSVTNGSAIVNRTSGAPFLGQMTGSGMAIGGVTYQILSVQSTAQLTLTVNYAGTTLSSVAWVMTPALLTGNVLNPQTNPAVWPLVNHCWRELEDELLRLGVETFTKNFDMYGLEATQATQNRTTLYINWNGYWDGNPNGDLNDAVKLPDDLLEPLEMWESPSGQNYGWIKMTQAADMLTGQWPTNRFQQWAFYDNALHIPQCTLTNDLRLRYLAYSPDLTGPTSVLVVPHSKTALANLIAATASASRGGTQMASFYTQKYTTSVGQIATRTARREDYSKFVRKPFRGGYRGEGRGRGFWAGPTVS